MQLGRTTHVYHRADVEFNEQGTGLWDMTHIELFALANAPLLNDWQ